MQFSVRSKIAADKQQKQYNNETNMAADSFNCLLWICFVLYWIWYVNLCLNIVHRLPFLCNKARIPVGHNVLFLLFAGKSTLSRMTWKAFVHQYELHCWGQWWKKCCVHHELVRFWCMMLYSQVTWLFIPECNYYCLYIWYVWAG